MSLPDCLHCPECQGRLTPASTHGFRCDNCGRTLPLKDGIVDLAGASDQLPAGGDRYIGAPHEDSSTIAELPARIKNAAGGWWPASLGDVIEFGCGPGQMNQAIFASETFRSLLVFDTNLSLLQACRAGMLSSRLRPGPERPVTFAALGGRQNVVRDAVADTVIGTTQLAAAGDVRGFLAMVYHVLKPGGRALFVVPNRRYYQAVCQAIAEALVQRYARDGAWPSGFRVITNLLARMRRLLVYRSNVEFLSALKTGQLFDGDALEELSRELGFATAAGLPLDPDPIGIDTMRRVCLHAGAPDSLAQDLALLGASAGRPFLSLLSQQDSSPSLLLLLTKGSGPTVRTYTGGQRLPAAGFSAPDVAVAGAAPRWSVELLARDTPDGVVVKVSGWCLSNIDAQWVRLKLGDVVQCAPVWRPRPDVHEVLNSRRTHNPLNALCSGLESELLFAGQHPEGSECRFRLDIVLAGDLIVTGPTPEHLVMDQQMVVAH